MEKKKHDQDERRQVSVRRTMGESLTEAGHDAGLRGNATRKGDGRMTADVVSSKNVIINDKK